MIPLVVAIVALTAQPIQLPSNFDPAVNLPGKTTENGRFHESRGGAGLASWLVSNGTPEDIAMAVKVLDATFSCQETRPGARHVGNFRWMYEDDRVTDLNAVEFCLSSMIPMMIRHGDRLPEATRQQALDSIRLGLQEIDAIDVTLAYTNIAVYDIVNTCLGGELLGDEAIAQRGYRRLREWEVITCQNGATTEFNSPTYTRIAMGALHRLSSMTVNEEARIRARTMLTRVGLSVALRIHKGTGRWAGPHSRCYQPHLECETGSDERLIHNWAGGGVLPSWMMHAVDDLPLPMQVTETASVRREVALTTHQSPSFAMGTATGSYSRQANVLTLHYSIPGAERPGVVYARYLSNDKWLGDWYHRTDRTSSRNLIDEGRFYGVQDGPRAIGLYGFSNYRDCTSAKAALIWTQGDHVDEIWVGGRKIDALPTDIDLGDVVVVASGDALVAIQPLALTDLGGGAPIRLDKVSGDLVFQMYNYEGPETRLRFFADPSKCAFYVEAAERSEYPGGRAFGKVVADGKVKQKHKKRTGSWSIEYRRDGRELGIEVDLKRWKLERRWTHDGDLGWPMLESPVARQNAEGRVQVGDAVLECGKEPAWLYAAPDANTWVAGYHGDSGPLTLTVPGGKVHVPSLSTGTVAWVDGRVTVDAVGLADAPVVEGGALAE
ncbi:MAG: hypothetical protein GY851_22480 [bacterium]|nr:hypothetical protein [bacterium]